MNSGTQKDKGTQKETLTPGDTGTKTDTGTQRVPGTAAPQRRGGHTSLAGKIDAEKTSDSECDLRSELPTASYGLCHGAECRGVSTGTQHFAHSGNYDTYSRLSVPSTPYHQKVLPTSQNSEQNGAPKTTNPMQENESIFYIMSLVFEPGPLSPKQITAQSFSSLRAVLFTVLLLSNCLLSSASRVDSVGVRGLRTIGSSNPDAAQGLTLNRFHHSDDGLISTNTNDNSMDVEYVREKAVNSNPAPNRGILPQLFSARTEHPPSHALPTSQDTAHPSFYRSSILYASDGSSSGAASDPSVNNKSDTSSSNYSPTGRPLRGPDSCEVSNIKCALRTGCGMALQKYMLDCADLINGHTDGCDSHCRDSLLILTSTSEGRALMDCECTNDYCRATKARLEVCRAQVLSAGAQDGALSCRLAHLVCTADNLCATAIAYYDKFCRRMFSGRSCSPRCNNSIAILQRQQQARRLETCECDGTEPFACADIKSNMARLCFHQVDTDDREKQEEETNEIDTSPVGGKGPATKSGAVGVTALPASDVLCRLLLIPLLVLVLQTCIYGEQR